MVCPLFPCAAADGPARGMLRLATIFVARKLYRMTSAALPGAELIEAGLRDLSSGTESVESLLVSIAATRLRALGIDVPTPIENPELILYRRLAAVHGYAAHARYNALVRRLVSYQRAAACAK